MNGIYFAVQKKMRLLQFQQNLVNQTNLVFYNNTSKNGTEKGTRNYH